MCTGGKGLYSEGKQKKKIVISRASVLEGKVRQSYYFTFTVSAAKLSFHSTTDYVRRFWRHTSGYLIHNGSGRSSSRHVWVREVQRSEVEHFDSCHKCSEQYLASPISEQNKKTARRNTAISMSSVLNAQK